MNNFNELIRQIDLNEDDKAKFLELFNNLTPEGQALLIESLRKDLNSSK